MTKLLEVKNISKKFNTTKGEIEAIKDISFDVNEGEFIAIVGTSGCGKSTLLSILANLTKQTDGTIKYYKDNPVIGYMLQEDALDLLKKYNLEKFINQKPSELSGGMKQRVA